VLLWAQTDPPVADGAQVFQLGVIEVIGQIQPPSLSREGIDRETLEALHRDDFEGSVYDDFTAGGNTDFEWRWSDAHATRTALHWKRDVHREVDEVGAPEEHYEDRSGALALEHEWQAA
jgi:iron complex outermembrane receptor protein